MTTHTANGSDLLPRFTWENEWRFLLSHYLPYSLLFYKYTLKKQNRWRYLLHGDVLYDKVPLVGKIEFEIICWSYTQEYWNILKSEAYITRIKYQDLPRNAKFKKKWIITSHHHNRFRLSFYIRFSAYLILV